MDAWLATSSSLSAIMKSVEFSFSYFSNAIVQWTREIERERERKTFYSLRTKFPRRNVKKTNVLSF